MQPASLKPCVGSLPESKYVRILASVLFQICQYARIGQVDSPRMLPIPARYLNKAFQNALRFGFDRQFAPRVETAWTEIDRPDYGSLAVRDHNLAVQLQVPWKPRDRDLRRCWTSTCWLSPIMAPNFISAAEAIRCGRWSSRR